MRKLFWSCFVSGVCIAAAVFTMATMAVRHPDSFAGQLMYGASRVAVAMNPFSGFAPTLARLEKAHKVPLRRDAGAEEPSEVVAHPEDVLRGIDPPPVAESAPAMPILIPEDEPIPAASMPVLPDTRCPVHPEAFQPGTECPPGESANAAPLVMPRCEEENENFDRIGIDFETLPMPKVEEQPEEQEPNQPECPLGCADKLLRMFEKMIKRGVGQTEQTGEEQECREDPYHHHHHQGCPYTGRCYPGCPGMSPCRPQSLAPEPAERPAAEEKPPIKDDGQSALKKIRRLKTRIEEFCPVHGDVDTMEHRATDRKLYDLGTGPL